MQDHVWEKTRTKWSLSPTKIAKNNTVVTKHVTTSMIRHPWSPAHSVYNKVYKRSFHSLLLYLGSTGKPGVTAVIRYSVRSCVVVTGSFFAGASSPGTLSPTHAHLIMRKDTSMEKAKHRRKSTHFTLRHLGTYAPAAAACLVVVRSLFFVQPPPNRSSIIVLVPVRRRRGLRLRVFPFCV